MNIKKHLPLIGIVVLIVIASFFVSKNFLSVTTLGDSPDLVITNNIVTYTNINHAQYLGDFCNSAYSNPYVAWRNIGGTPIRLASGSNYYDPCGHYHCGTNEVRLEASGATIGGTSTPLRWGGIDHPLSEFPTRPSLSVSDWSVASCPDGCTTSGNTLQCHTGMYCIPDKVVCYYGELQSCTSDGKQITHTPCAYKCVEDTCVIPISNMISIQNTLASSHISVGDAISTNVRMIFDNQPYQNGVIDIGLYNQGVLLKQIQGYTDVNGNVIFNFPSSNYVGTHTIKIKATAYNVYREFSFDFNVYPICTPNLVTCNTYNSLKICNSDGSKYTITQCDYKCLTTSGVGSCVPISSDMIKIDFAPRSDYVINVVIPATVKVSFDGSPSPYTTVEGFIYKDSQLLRQTLGVTDANGYVTLSFSSLQTTFHHTLVIKATTHGVSKEISQDIYVNGVCVAGFSSCEGERSVKSCNMDGAGYSYELCEYKCSAGECTSMPTDISLTADTQPGYFIGDRISFPVYVNVNGVPYTGAIVTGKVMRGDSLKAQVSGTSDENGRVLIDFGVVDTEFENNIIISTEVRGIQKSITKQVYVSGSPIKLKSPTAPSFIQYSTKPVEFEVELIDPRERAVDPISISNVKVVASITNGNVIASSVDYLGEGKYRILSNVTGTGTYIGSLSFTYSGKLVNTLTISIDIRLTKVDVFVGDNPTSACVGNITTYKMNFFSSTGGYIDPDNIQLKISPSTGINEYTLTQQDLTKVDVGQYKFDYTITEIEKWTFDVYATKGSYATGSARFSVAGIECFISPPCDLVCWFIKLRYWIIGGIIVSIVAIIIFTRKKK